MQKFYEVVYIWSDGNKVIDAIYTDSLDAAIDKAKMIIGDTATIARELKEGYGVDKDYVKEVHFFRNGDEKDIYCIVTSNEARRRILNGEI